MTKIPHLRWIVGLLLFGAAILNYIDRQALSILAPTIQQELRLSETDYGHIASAFLVAYTVSLLLSGRLVDRFGPRWSMAFFVAWWSLANILTATARSAASLGCFRFLLGLGEAGNWPASTKVVSEWFPARERGLAVGLYTMGATLGATIAPILITGIVVHSNWQMAFVVTGFLGLLWVVPWICLYRSPHEHPRITEAERALLPAPTSSAGVATVPWSAAFCRRDVWVLMIARMLTDPVWYFFQFWYAKYLFSSRGVPQEELGITWVVFLAADIGALSGGFLSAYLIKKGNSVTSGRLKAMLVSACLLPLTPLVAYADSVHLSLAFSMVVVCAHLAWLANISALLVDVIPVRQVASAFGVVAAGSALGGILMNQGVAWLVQNHSYTPWFVLCAFLHPCAWLLVRLGLPADDQGSLAPRSERQCNGA